MGIEKISDEVGEQILADLDEITKAEAKGRVRTYVNLDKEFVGMEMFYVDLAESCIRRADLSFKNGNTESIKKSMAEAREMLAGLRTIGRDKESFRDTMEDYNLQVEKLKDAGIEVRKLLLEVDQSRIIIAPTYLERIDAPLIFLAGPIQGAEKWQDEAIELIQEQDSELYVASPRRNVTYKKGDFSKEMSDEQIDWETKYLREAGDHGTVLFWLAKEVEHRCDRSYAQTTRSEFSEWKMRHQYEGSDIVVGIEEGYTGAKYIRRRMAQDCPEVKIHSTLEGTCQEAVELAYFSS